ncbi:MAG: primary-amine oxidase [Dehalococcoidia bacterium]
MQAPSSIAVTHPLDLLTAEEISAAVAILRRERALTAGVRFMRITLQEPDKATAWNGADGSSTSMKAAGPIERVAHIILRDRDRRLTCEAVVSIRERTLQSWRELPGVQPHISADEFLASDRAIRDDPRWQAAMRQRGVDHFELAMVDPWSAGYYGPEDDPERRLIRALTWIRSSPEDNGYSRPIEGLVTLFDLDRLEVVRIEDHGVVPLPPRSGNYTAEGIRDPNNVPHFESARTDLRPVEIRQPEGTSFEVNGHGVRWQKWNFRVGFTPREGLVLHTVAYEDRGKLRPILHRASLSEMLVPYGDPSPTHWRKNAFDEGEYGLGMLANALELGCDCLGEISYFDAAVSDADGCPVTLPNVICMHEEDFGMLWKHTDFRTGKVEVRRSRRLVVSSISTVGNYEYGFYWYFYQDGTIEYQIKMTGIMSTGAIAPGAEPAYGQRVAPGLYGPNHQHYFNVRLDMMVDGPVNSIYEQESESVPLGPENPHGNAWRVRSTLLGRESEAARLIDPLKARSWKIVNPSAENAVGEPVAYRLLPGENVLPFSHPDSHLIRRAGFITRHLWVTRYDPAERYAAGDYPNQHPGGAGLPAYVAQDRPLENADLVLWYTMGSHHVVRPEDWPVMPVSTIGFQLKPSGFFDGNPALDLPPAHVDHCQERERNGIPLIEHEAHP